MFTVDYDNDAVSPRPEAIVADIAWFCRIQGELGEMLRELIAEKQTEAVIRRRDLLEELIQGAADAEKAARDAYYKVSFHSRRNFEEGRKHTGHPLGCPAGSLRTVTQSARGGETVK